MGIVDFIDGLAEKTEGAAEALKNKFNLYEETCQACGDTFLMQKVDGQKTKPTIGKLRVGFLCKTCMKKVHRIMDRFEKEGKDWRYNRSWGWKKFIEANEWILESPNGGAHGSGD